MTRLRERINPKGRGLLISWLISYISILLIPIVISGFVYVESVRIVEREINNSNFVMLKQIQRIVDKKMSDVKCLSLQIAWAPEIESLINYSVPMDSHGRFVISQVRDDLHLYKVANSYIDKIYIYLHNTDMFVSSSTSYSMDLLETVLTDYEKITAQQFKTLSQQVFMHRFTAMKIWQGTNKEQPAIAYIQSLPYGLQNKNKATMLILLDYNTFLDEVSSIEGLQRGTVLILDEKNRIVAKTDPDDKISGIKYEELEDDSLLHKKITGNEFVMSSISSQINDWKYIFVLPSAVFMEKVEYIKKLTGCSIILCLVIGGIVAYVFTKKNYNPIQEMVRALAKSTGIQLNPALDEYGFIREAISNTLNEKEIIEQKLKKQNKALRSGFLARLIKGRSDQVVPIDEALSSYGIQWIGDSFCVILFYMDDFKRLFDGAPSSNPIGQLKLVQFIITNIVEELIGRKYKGFVTEVDDMMACLVNMDDEHMEEQSGKQEHTGKNELFSIVKEAQCIIRENFFIHLTISVGNIHQTIAGIPQSYQEALEAMEYRMVMGSERIISYDEIRNPGNRYDYPLELEQQLINSVRIGDFHTAKEITNDVFQRHFSGEMLSVELTKCLLFDLMSTIMKALNDINIPNSSAFIEKLRPIARISGSNTVMEMKYEMMDILKKVCEYIACSKKDRNQNITEKIIAIVNESYSDVNLSISNIAGEFGLTGPYVSKIFRDHMGEGIQDYMNKVRLNQAKALLTEKHENLDKIAKTVGYTNSNGLIRVFKKYEGLTPGQFREMNR